MPRRPPASTAAATQVDVEDTKGNNGEAGEMTVTSLRVVWVCRRARRTNISIGLDTITQISVKPAASRLRGGRGRAAGAAGCSAGGTEPSGEAAPPARPPRRHLALGMLIDRDSAAPRLAQAAWRRCTC
jgi:hypothetical protein